MRFKLSFFLVFFAFSSFSWCAGTAIGVASWSYDAGVMIGCSGTTSICTKSGCAASTTSCQASSVLNHIGNTETRISFSKWYVTDKCGERFTEYHSSVPGRITSSTLVNCKITYTNSGVVRSLDNNGVPDTWYSSMHSSGDLVYLYITDNTNPTDSTTNVKPPCSTPKSISEPLCIGGVGTSVKGSEVEMSTYMVSKYGFAQSNPVTYFYQWNDGNQGAFFRDADKTSCNSTNSGSGAFAEFVYCPQGLTELPPEPPEPPPLDCEATPSHPDCYQFDRDAYCEIRPEDTFICGTAPPPPNCVQTPNDPRCAGANVSSNSGTSSASNPVASSSGSGTGSSSGSGAGSGTGDGPGSSGSGSGVVTSSGSGSSSPSGSGDGSGGGLVGGGGTPVVPGSSSGSNSGGDGNGDSPNGVSCKELGNCDWAKESTQRTISGTLDGILDAITSGLSSVASSLLGLPSSIASAVSDILSGSGDGSGPDDGVGSGDGTGSGNGGSGSSSYPPYCYDSNHNWKLECGGNGSGPVFGGGSASSGSSWCDDYPDAILCQDDYPGVSSGDFDCSGVLGFFRKVFTSSCGNEFADVRPPCDPSVDGSCGTESAFDADTVFGITREYLETRFDDYGVSKKAYVHSIDSLVRDSSFVFRSIRSGIQPFTSCFNSAGSSSSVLDFSFHHKYFSCDAACRIDLKNFYGINAADVFNTLITFALVIASCVRLIRVAKTFGTAA